MVRGVKVYTLSVYCLEIMFFFSLPEAESHQQEIQTLEENKEDAQDAIRKTNKKDFWSYGENKAGTVSIHIQKSSERIPRKCADLNSLIAC